MEHDAWFFVGIFAFIFLIWIATGGPTHTIAFTGPSLSQPQELGGGTYLGLPRAPFGIKSSSISSGGSRDSATNYKPIIDLSGVAFGDPSPYRGDIILSKQVSGASSTNARREYLRLSASRSLASPMNISGWKITSEATGKTGKIPQGAEVPTGGRVNSISNIVLSPGDRAYINTGGPLIGVSFKENKCTGYFAQYQDFIPSLSKNCPTPKSEFEEFYGPYYIRDESCIKYVNSLSRCTTVLYTPRELSSACKAFVKKYLNYNGCVAAHRNDDDFYSNTWRIYLGYSDALWRSKNEVIKLLDLNSKTVSAISY